MASIKIHQDVYNFERKRAGFTTRQWVAIGVAVALAAGLGLLLLYALQLPFGIASPIVLMFAVIPAVVGFMPIHNNNAEDYILRKIELDRRGNALSWEGEDPCLEPGKVTKDYAKSKKQKGFECC